MKRVLLALAMLVGCGGEGMDAGTGGDGGSAPTSCVPGELALEDGSCRAAGVPPDLPAPGPTAPPQAGVPEGACYEGFVSDGEGGCTAILPATPCASGTMAIPGDTECREVAPCGTGTWGPIPIEPGAEFVDGSFSGPSDGTANAPWKTVQAAIDAAAAGDIVAIAAGSYAENLVVDDKPVRLWGRCPALVEIVGTIPMTGIIEMAAVGSEVHTLAVTGIGSGVNTNTPGGTLTDRVWVHDTTGAGVVVYGGGEASELRDSLFERTTSAAIIVEGSTLTVARTEVDDTQVWTDGYRGLALHLVRDPQTDAPSAATISRCYFHDSKDFAIAAYGSALELRGTLVRETNPTTPGDVGWGLYAFDPSSSTVVVGSVFASNTSCGLGMFEGSANVTTTTVQDTKASLEDGYGEGMIVESGAILELDQSIVRDNIGSGIWVNGAEARIARTMVQRTASNPLDSYGSGDGIDVTEYRGAATVEIDECEIADNTAAGVFVQSSALVMRESVVRRTSASAMFDVGIGIAATVDQDLLTPAVLNVTHSLVEESTGHGITSYGCDVELVSSIVRDTRPSLLGELGIGVVLAPAPTLPSQGRIYGSIIEKSYTVGIGVDGSALDLEATVVRDVLPQESTQTLGRGLFILASDTEGRAQATLRWSEIENVYDTGVFMWSSDVELEGVVVRDVTTPPVSNGEAFGLAAVAGPELADPARVSVAGSLIERVVVAGLVVEASEMTVTGTLVRDVVGRPLQGDFGYGLFAQKGARLDVRDSLVERTAMGGIGYMDSSGAIDAVTVRDIAAAGDGRLGDGLVAVLSDVSLRGSQMERLERAGLSAFGARISIEDVEVVCAAMDVDVETVDGTPSEFLDVGENRCGCPLADRVCEAVSAGVAPPAPIGLD